MKAQTKLVSGLLAVALLLSGCEMTQEKAVERYKNALDKNLTLKSYEQEMQLDMSMSMAGMDLDMTMAMELAAKDSGKNAQMKMTVDVLGESQALDMYVKDGVLYSTVPGQEGVYLKQDDINAILALTDGESSQMYKEAIDKAQDLTFEETENKDVVLSFSFAPESLSAMEDELGAMLEESMTQGLDAQMEEQYGALGLDEETLKTLVEQTMQVYKDIFTNVKVDSITQKATVNKAGFLTAQDLDISLLMDWTPLFTMLGQELDDATQQQLSQAPMTMKITQSVDNINGDVEVTLPDINESNIVTQ